MTTSGTDHHTGGGPGRGPEEVLVVLDRELSRSARLRYLLVGLVSLVVTGVTGSLWATEPSLPLRTHVAFGGIVVLGMAWMGVAAFVLTRRRPLYATDRVLATGTALVATSAVAAVTTVLAATRGGVLPALTAGTVGAVFVAASVVLHLGARRRRRALLARRRALGLEALGS